MADLSLDDFIRQKNVKVQIKNTSQPRGQIQRKNAVVNKFQNRPVQRTFDARSKLGPKTVTDARNKIIINKKNGKGDARSKIVQKQVQKGTFDARSLLKKSKKTNGALINPPGPQINLPGVQQLTRTLSNPVNMGQISSFQVTRQIPGTEVTLSKDSLQVTKRGLGSAPVPNIGDAVPIIQIRNDRYQQRQEMQSLQPSWSNQSSRLPQPAHVEMQYSHSSYTPANRPHTSQHHYQDFDDPEFNNKSSISVHEIPKMHISNIKTIEAAGMRPVSSRPAPPLPRAPPGAATLSAKQPITMSQTSSGALKRRQQPLQEVGGPLRLGKGGGPGVQVGIGESSPPKKAKPGTMASEPIEIIDLEDSSKYVSPLQGFRVVVTNLFSGVTQDDIIELFGVVGPLKKARLLKAGSAEVVYTLREDALKAVQKYHGRELDGQPMYVKMTTPTAAVVKTPQGIDPDITGEALRLYKKPSSLGALPEAPIEVPTIHRALFKVGPPAPNKSVKFTVKI